MITTSNSRNNNKRSGQHKAVAIISLLACLSVVLYDAIWSFEDNDDINLYDSDYEHLRSTRRLANEEEPKFNALSSSSIVRKKCSDEWGKFSKGLLTQTRINSQPSLWDYETCYKKMYASGTLCHRDSWKEANSGLIIHPPSKFAFCQITKNGCSQWTTVLAKLFHDNSNIKHSHYGLSQESFKKYGIEGLNSIFSDPDATKVVMARDPLARFASAYLDKCFAMNCANPFCFPRTGSAGIQKGQPVTFRKAINWILTQNVSRIDTHWKLQSEHCNLRTHISDYNIVALMDKDHMSSDASCIMDIAGINDYNKQNSTSIEPFWKPFHKMTNYRQESELDILKKLFTPDIARLLVEKFRQDYDIFQLPEPNWIEDSTGEWLDSTDHHRCVTSK